MAKYGQIDLRHCSRRYTTGIQRDLISAIWSGRFLSPIGAGSLDRRMEEAQWNHRNKLARSLRTA